MNKLKNKVFFIIVLILTIFSLSITIIFNYQSYAREKNNVENNLTRIGGREPEKNENDVRRGQFPNKPAFLEEKDEEYDDRQLDIRQRIFMDSTVYTIILDERNNISEVINHSEDDKDENEIKNIAKKVIEEDSGRKGMKIGNLYFDKYSYSFRNNSLTIIDNSSTNENLRKELSTSVVIFILAEIIILYLSKKITVWATKPAIQALDSQKQFITDASHELKTPISVILASAEALENDYQEKWIDNIKSESERMNRLITNLLNLSKIENTFDKSLYSQNNLSKIIENSTLTFEGIMYDKKIELKTNIQENIDLNCNSDEIKQLVAILVDNAIKHSEENGKITVLLKKEKNNIIFEVINKGKAIPKEEQEKIFERFYRADESRNRDDNRYGLGLAIAKGIVLKHNGRIFANSKDGYTTFKVIF